MALGAALAISLLLLAPLALACDTRSGACTATHCATPTWAWIQVPSSATAVLSSLNNNNHVHLGQVTTTSNKVTKLTSTYGGSWNYEYFTNPTKNIVSQTTVSDPSSCCSWCAKTTNCQVWMWYPTAAHGYTLSFPVPMTSSNKYTGDSSGTVVASTQTLSFAAPASTLPSGVTGNCVGFTSSFSPANDWGGTSKTSSNTLAIVGGNCNPASTMVNDPHLEGARGTRFDFNGGLHESYCLLSDRDVHINTLLDGYVNASAATTGAGAKALRTWVKEVGLVWNDKDGAQHTAHFVARSGKQQARGAGFLKSLTLDGAPVAALPRIGDRVASAGGLEVAFVAQEKKHIFDVDYYTVRIEGLLLLDMRMRVAHPALQSPTDAQAHFNLGISYIASTPEVHGVLGQTYRPDVERAGRATKYQTIAHALHGPLAADGESGRGFLDGSTADYVSSSVLAPDCTYSKFVAPHISSVVAGAAA